MEERMVADVVCPLCGLPIEVAQQFVRPADEKEYMTVRCMSDHYLTIPLEDADLLIVGNAEATLEPLEDMLDKSVEEEPGID